MCSKCFSDSRFPENFLFGIKPGCKHNISWSKQYRKGRKEGRVTWMQGTILHLLRIEMVKMVRPASQPDLLLKTYRELDILYQGFYRLSATQASFSLHFRLFASFKISWFLYFWASLHSNQESPYILLFLSYNNHEAIVFGWLTLSVKRSDSAITQKSRGHQMPWGRLMPGPRAA